MNGRNNKIAVHLPCYEAMVPAISTSWNLPYPKIRLGSQIAIIPVIPATAEATVCSR